MLIGSLFFAPSDCISLIADLKDDLMSAVSELFAPALHRESRKSLCGIPIVYCEKFA